MNSAVDRNARIMVAGARGMVGSALVRRLTAGGYTNVLAPARAELDYLDGSAVHAYLAQHRPDYLFIAAAKVGGIHANNTYRAQFLYDNLMIQNHLIHGAHLADVQRLMFLGSSCIYPKLAPQPLKEEYLLTGLLEPTNEPYAIAKIAGIKLCESYNAQYGRQYVSAMPTNLFGPNDNYDLQNSHVLPALLRKVHLAKLGMERNLDAILQDEARHGRIPDDILRNLGCQRSPAGAVELSTTSEPSATLLVWGSGTPLREFLYVDDMADACAFLMEKGIGSGLYNIGSGSDVTIRELTQIIMNVVGFRGELVFDATKPDGTPRKLLDVSRLKELGWAVTATLKQRIEQTYAALLGTV